jgi:hypothetical protein
VFWSKVFNKLASLFISRFIDKYML